MSGLPVRNPGDRCIWAHGAEQESIATHLPIIAQRDPSENRGPSANHYTITKFRPERQVRPHADLPGPKVTPLHPSQFLMRQ
jgi:hypothetical protein